MLGLRKDKRLVRTEDLTGLKFGRLLVKEFAGYKMESDGKHRAAWICLCDCGEEYIAIGKCMKSKNTQSCGCFLRESVKLNRLKHGHSANGIESFEYLKWYAMKARCYYPKHKNFHNYGGRGIRVCRRWRYSFENFLADMGKCPPGLTLERRDTNGNYEPSNCVWATISEQANNKRTSRFISHRGITQTISQWAKSLGVRPGMIWKRLHMGWEIPRALSP